jgi:hypothetical protein
MRREPAPAFHAELRNALSARLKDVEQVTPRSPVELPAPFRSPARLGPDPRPIPQSTPMRLSLSTAILTLAASTFALPVASAQQTVFFDDFENGSGNWTLEADWHLTPMNMGTICVPNISTPSGVMVARFGYSGACGYNQFKGRMTLAAPVAIPADASAARLRFASYDHTECSGTGNCGWDHRSIFVSDDGGASWDLVWEPGASATWIDQLADLSAYIGESVLVAFEFDPVDTVNNHTAGWILDDVQIEIDELGGPSIYCKPKKNSMGCGPIMSYVGNGSLTGPDDLVLTTTSLRNNVWGSYAWSTGVNNVPFNGGTLCVQIPAKRTTVVSTGGGPPSYLDCSGTYTWFFSHAYLQTNGPVPGQTLYCQYFGRDVGSGAPMTLSNAVAVPILP